MYVHGFMARCWGGRRTGPINSSGSAYPARGGRGGLRQLIPADIGKEGGHNLDRLPVNHRADRPPFYEPLTAAS